ncbi:hypothetical protein F1654_00475 [Alkalicaulis satelles]|uniref:DUF6456 domain-containing protein n=1 Tax=Alkalicaulis satelles TaxID=2609175 RepID=A0A5M6ZJK1_9PROT|nr:DUF6456 domain-containing protein [Alkalicaulis satelles]KAA5804520.1 hypothetical protein F1654_00475 [Alkalicaulis satelles]
MSAPSWMKRLDAPGRVLAPLPAGRKGFGVFQGPDRRRRPMAIAREAEVREAAASGALEHSEAGWRLTSAGRARLKRADAGGDFGAQHRKTAPRIVMDDDGRERVTQADIAAGSPLARYARPQGGRPALIEPVHAAAAAMLRHDYERSALMSRVTMDWSGQPGARTRSAPRDRSDAPSSRLAAQSRVLDALEAAGPGLDRLLTALVLRDTPMGEAERELGWPARAGAPALRLALERLAVHYRLTAPAQTFNPFSAAGDG